MMTSINTLVTASQILTECGLPVKRAQGACPCVLCGGNDLSMYVTSVTDLGPWFNCDVCGFNGDGIELLATYNRMPIKAVVSRKKDQNPTQFTQDLVNDYLLRQARTQAQRKNWLRLSYETCRYTRGHPYSDLIQHCGLQVISVDNWPMLGAPWFAWSTSSEISELMGFRSNLPGKPTKPYVLSPLYRAQGCISGVVGYGVGDGCLVHSIAELEYGSKDALTFLCQPHYHDDTVMASSCLGVVSRLQAFALGHGRRAPLPLLGYTDESMAVWDCVQAGKIIIWEPTPSIAVFKKARFIGNRAYLSFSEQPLPCIGAQGSIVVSRNIGVNCADDALTVLAGNAVPWHVALKDYLLSLSSVSAVQVADELRIDGTDRLKILTCCTDVVDRSRLEKLLSDQGSPTAVASLPDGGTVQDLSDGLFLVRKGKPPHKLCSARPRVHRYTLDENGDPILMGTCVVSGRTRKEFEFTVAKKDFTARWLERICAQQAQEIITVDPTLTRSLFRIVTELYSPEYVKGVSRLGWQKDTESFIFPSAAISADGHVSAPDQKVTVEHPSSSYSLSVEFTADACVQLLRETDKNFWALFGAVIGQMLAPALEKPSYGVAIVSDDKPDTELLSWALGLELVTGQDLSKQTLKRVQDCENKHNLPCIASMPGLEGMMKLLSLDGTRNLVTTFSKKLLQRLNVRDDWVQLPAPKLPVNYELARACVLGVLSYFQRHRPDGFMLEYHPAALGAIFVRRFVNLVSPTSELDGIERIIVVPDEGYAGSGERFCRTILLLLEAQCLRLQDVKTDEVHLPIYKADIVLGSTRAFIRKRSTIRSMMRYGSNVKEDSHVCGWLSALGLEPEEHAGVIGLDGWSVDRRKFMQYL